MENKAIKIENLEPGKIYTDLLDLATPLYFTGRVKEVKDYFCTTIHAYFTPVETKKNKNYYKAKGYWKQFSPEGNEYIIPAQ